MGLIMAPVLYELKRRRGLRGVRLTVYPGGRIVVTAPRSYPRFFVERLVQERALWLQEKQALLARRPVPLLTQRDPGAYRNEREESQKFVAKKVAFWAGLVGATPARIRICDPRTRWGSCSQTGTLSFSYKVAYLPGDLADYVIVHELCHLLVWNHSTHFWGKVERCLPDWRERRARLRAI